MPQLTSEFYAAAGGAVVGSVVGGVISYLLQMYSLGEARKQRKEDAEERRKALASALLFKAIQVHSHLKLMSDHIEESFHRAEHTKFKGEPWAFVLPLANTPQKVTFSSDEMAMLLALKEQDIFNDLASKDELHNATIDVFEVYRARRTVLVDMLPAHQMEGTQGSTSLTKEQLALVRPRMAELDQLITSLRHDCRDGADKSGVALHKLANILNAKTGLSVQLLPAKEDAHSTSLNQVS